MMTLSEAAALVPPDFCPPGLPLVPRLHRAGGVGDSLLKNPPPALAAPGVVFFSTGGESLFERAHFEPHTKRPIQIISDSSISMKSFMALPLPSLDWSSEAHVRPASDMRGALKDLRAG